MQHVLACKGDPIANLQEDLAAEQKARATYEKLIDLCRDNPDVIDPLKIFKRKRSSTLPKIWRSSKRSSR